MKKISSGAEAIIYQNKDKVTKHRISKSYRHPELDKKIIKRRTKAETKILTKTSEIIPSPKPEEQKEHDKIIMPFIEGDKLSTNLDNYPQDKQEKIMFELGKTIAKLHKEDIIHGDLTTSNMIYSESKIFIIDFGLGFQNGKYEDKGVDIHLLKQALEAKHFKAWEILFKEFEVGYRSMQSKPEEAQKVFDRMKAIEKRGRYRH
ncbi:Kae1-associated serine/threonine protein kinase [archaeon]|jgi:TP53 regulating kinase and related kinases|nr:Kae1-associated serine/threonine protein kinase [archaeon]